MGAKVVGSSPARNGVNTYRERMALFRRGEILPDGRPNEDETNLIKTDTNPTNFHQPRMNTDGARIFTAETQRARDRQGYCERLADQTTGCRERRRFSWGDGEFRG